MIVRMRLAASAAPMTAATVVFLMRAMRVDPSGAIDAAEGLREQHVAAALAEGQPDRAGRLGLAGRHGVDAGAQGLADEGRVVDRQHR